MEDGAPARIDRRRSLQVAGLAGLGLELAACAPPAAPPIPSPTAKPATSNQTGPVINTDAPHPDAAKPMVDWWLSKAGQQEDVVKVTKRFPIRPGVELPDYLKGVQVFNPPVENNRLVAKAAPEFRQIFNIK